MKNVRGVLVTLLLVGTTFMSLFGCAAGDRFVEGTTRVTDPDKVRLQTKLTWANPQPRIRAVSGDKMVVYARVKNSAGADVSLRTAVEDALEDSGYELTRNIDEAQFIIRADLRHFGEGSETNIAPVAVGAGLGAVAGGVLGHNVGGGRTTEGALAGAAVGGLVGKVAANRNKIRTINLIVDVSIGERIGQKVSTRRRAGSETEVSHAGNISGGAGRETGRSSAGSSEEQAVELEEDFLYHENRVTVSATRMNLALGEAAPVLTRKLSLAVANALP